MTSRESNQNQNLFRMQHLLDFINKIIAQKRSQGLHLQGQASTAAELEMQMLIQGELSKLIRQERRLVVQADALRMQLGYPGHNLNLPAHFNPSDCLKINLEDYSLKIIL